MNARVEGIIIGGGVKPFLEKNVHNVNNRNSFKNIQRKVLFKNKIGMQLNIFNCPLAILTLGKKRCKRK